MGMKLGYPGLLALALSIGSAPAFAATKVYDSFGKGYTNCNCTSPIYSGPNDVIFFGHHAVWLAATFSPSKSGTLDYLDVSIGGVGYPGATIILIADNGSGAPDTVNSAEMETWVDTKVPVFVGSGQKKTKLASKLHPSLTAGTKYWIIIEPISVDTAGYWWQSPSAMSPVLASADGGGTWSGYTGSQTAFDVFVQ